MNVPAMRVLLKRAHIATILIIALTTTLILAGMYWLSYDDDLLPKLVNIAGKQRALTRQISFVEYRLKTSPREDTAALQKELRTLADTFEHSHAMLTGKQPIDGRETPLTQAIQRYYTSHLLSLDERVSRYARRAKEMAALSPSALANYPVPSQSDIEHLYDRLDGAVSLFERMLAEKSRQKNLWLLASILLLILVHVGCWLLLLRPASRKVDEAAESSEQEIKTMRQQEIKNNTSIESRGRFITTISQEFRSPISAIVGALELIPNMRDKQDELVQQAEQACFRLLTLTNNLLDIMGNNEDKAEPSEPKSFDLIALLDECISPYAAPSRTKKLEFGMHCETSLPTWVSGYPDSISKVVRNVLDNAIQFTPDGFINVLVNCQVADKGFKLTVTVVDSGVGIKEKDQPHIFERFFRVDAPGYQQYAGAGVGLTVAQKHIEQIGGKIHLASQASIGSEFTIEIPLTRSAISEPDRVPDSSVCFAVVDDLQISRLNVGNIINRAGYSARCFSCASEFLSQKDEITRYTAIIADFYMPGINGLELASTVTAMFGKHTPPVIMMSAAPDIANIMANSELGTWLAFVKPIDNLRLTDSLHQLAKQKYTDQPPISEARILIVEDEPINAQIIEHMVRCMGYVSISVHNGEDALQQLDQGSFDAVLLDINLPDINGIEVAAIAREKGLDIPIIAVTANAYAAEKEQSHDAGIRYHLVKPVTFQELKNTLRLSLSSQ